MAVNFTLNGRPRVEEVRPTMTVLDWLRGPAGLTGTKEGCAEGDCGACTILIARPERGGDAVRGKAQTDYALMPPHGSLPPCGGGTGRWVTTGTESAATPLPNPPPPQVGPARLAHDDTQPGQARVAWGREQTETVAGPCATTTSSLRWRAANACLMVMGQLDGCAVLTVEGVAPSDRLGAVQQALLDADATQCGFCTPGFVMAITDLEQDGVPDETAIHEALAGNLCRCTGYRAIIDACRAVSAAPPTPNVALPPRSARHDAAGETFLVPASLGELLQLRARHPAAVLLGGGTDLGLRISKGSERWPLTITTTAVAELEAVTDDGDAITVGGAATYSDMLAILDRRIPAFAALVRRIGSRQIRNLGTLAGNLATASPIGDTLPCLVALEARVRLASVRGARIMAVEDFITGYRGTALADDEIIEHIVIPVPAPNARFSAYKLSKRFDQDISTVVTAFHVAAGDGRVLRAAFGGMASTVARAKALEAAWAGGHVDDLVVAELEALVARDFSPLSDHRGSAAYRQRAAAGLVRRFILETRGDAVPLTLEAL